MSPDSDDNDVLPDEHADALLDQLAERADERDDLDLRPQRGFSRRETLAGLLGLGGVGTAAMSQRAQAAGESWGDSSGTVGTDSQPLQAVNAQNVDAQAMSVENSFTDPAGVEHTGELADAGDVAGSLTVEDDGTAVVSGAEAVSFGAGLSVTDDGDSSATVDSTSSGAIDLISVQSTSDLPTADGPTIAYVQDEDTYYAAADTFREFAYQSGDGGGGTVPSISTTDYWPIDAGSGTTVTNENSSRDMTTDATWATDAGVGGAYPDFDGTTSASVTNSSFASDSLTILGWFNADTTGTTNAIGTISGGGNSGINIVWDLNGNSGYGAFCNNAGGTVGGNASLGGGSQFSPGTDTWAFVAVTADYSASTLTMYGATASDGSLSQIDSSSDYTYNNDIGDINEIHLGGDGGGFDGGVDAVAYDIGTALSQSTLDAFFQDTKGSY